jgi:TRAP-type C4-dicarboxylate transport system substrate-binding protein
MKLTKYLAASLGAMLLASAPVHAQKLPIASITPPTHPMAREIHIPFADGVRKATNGKFDFQFFAAGALLPPLSIMQGVRDGVAIAGHVIPPYHVAEWPVNNLIGDMGWAAGDPLLLGSAYLDYAINDPTGSKEWRDNGSLPILTVATPLNHWLCRSVLRTLDDLKGKRVRSPGGGWARSAEALGVIPVNIPLTEAYTALERGTVDCVLTDPVNLVSGLNLGVLVKSVVALPFQPGYNVSQIALNIPFWRKATADERRILLNEANIVMARGAAAYHKETSEAIAVSKAKGIVFVEPEGALKAAYDKWVADGFGGVAKYYKVANPEKEMATFKGYLDKWAGLLKGVDHGNQAAIQAVLKANIFDKIDVNTYGMK